MNRMLVAILLSLAVHGALICWRFGWQITPPVDNPVRIITVQLPVAPPLPDTKAAATPETKVTPGRPRRTQPARPATVSPPQTAVTEMPAVSLTPPPSNDQPATTAGAGPGAAAAPPAGAATMATESSPAAKTQLAHPLYLENQPPGYPPLARKQRYQGTTELAVLVSKDGTADDLRLHNSSGHPILDQAALAAVRHWKFVPGQLGAEPVAMWVTVPVRFELQ